MTAVTNMDVKSAIDAICEYLNWDDDTVTRAAVSLRFPEFEHLDPEIRQSQFSRFELIEYTTTYSDFVYSSRVFSLSCTRVLCTRIRLFLFSKSSRTVSGIELSRVLEFAASFR